jgi:hypothetical protein
MMIPVDMLCFPIQALRHSMSVLGHVMTEAGNDPGLWTTGAAWELAMFAWNRVA